MICRFCQRTFQHMWSARYCTKEHMLMDTNRARKAASLQEYQQLKDEGFTPCQIVI